MKRKSRWIVAFVSLCAIATAIYLFAYFSPRSVVSNTGTESLQSIRHYGTQEYITLDVTQKKSVLELLSKYHCRRTMKTYFPFHGENADYELLLHTETEIPWNILIGKVNICYVSSNQGAFEIMDAQSLSAELNQIVG